MFGHNITLVEQQAYPGGPLQAQPGFNDGFSSLMGGLEVAYDHYRGSYSQRVMYIPVIISGLFTVSSFTSIFSRKVARTLLPLTARVMLVNGLAGLIFTFAGLPASPAGGVLRCTT